MLTVIFHSWKILSVSWMTAWASWTAATFVLFLRSSRDSSMNEWPFSSFILGKKKTVKMTRLLNFNINLAFSFPFFSQNESKWNFIPLKVFLVTSSTDFFLGVKMGKHITKSIYICACCLLRCFSSISDPSNKCCYEELETKEKQVCFNKVGTGC